MAERQRNFEVIKSVVFKGYLRTSKYKFNPLLLEQSNKYLIDIVCRLIELIQNYGDSVAIRYYVAPKRMNKDTIKLNIIKKYMGVMNVEFESEDYQYSELTSGVDYNTIFNVGGHDLYRELSNFYNMYLYIEIDFIKYV